MSLCKQRQLTIVLQFAGLFTRDLSFSKQKKMNRPANNSYCTCSARGVGPPAYSALA